eukprot:TRINITY_DN105444_c0_g1_i1.p1 TRINITY_DN105444_c0_g1~~TRINITY_DN105444_c0_g1_i1.p1  ORF type:complete len:373 (+),score=45.91 TRINITY_DN105444_c0_g1_i1:132-1121(+)
MAAACAGVAPGTPARRMSLSLGEEVVQVAPSDHAVFVTGLSTPANHVRPDLSLSMQMGTAAFRGSYANSNAAALLASATGMGAVSASLNGTEVMRPMTAPSPTNPMRPEFHLGADCSQVAAGAPMVPQSPTNGLRQPMMSRSGRSVRNAVAAANWGPEVATALAQTMPARPFTAPVPPSAASPSAASQGGRTVHRPPEAPPIGTPSNSQRQQMMFRTTVHTTRISEDSPVAGCPTGEAPRTPGHAQRAFGVTPLGSEAMHAKAGGVLSGISGLATPTNLDRRDAQMSLAMGIPSFRGSAATPTAVTVHGFGAKTPTNGAVGGRILFGRA